MGQLHIGAKAMKFAILTLLLLGVAVARRGGRGPKQCSDGSAPTCSDGQPPKEPCSDGNRPSCPEGETLVGRGRKKRCSGGGNPTCSDGADPVRPCDQGKPNTCPDGGRPQPCPRSSWVMLRWINSCIRRRQVHSPMPGW